MSINLKKIALRFSENEQFKKDIDLWVTTNTSKEKEIAKERILTAFNKKETYLDLSGLNLETLPDCIGQLTSLRTLDLNNNNLIDLPESIGQLTSLRRLYLNNNKLIDLPESIGQLTELTKLQLSYNELNLLPETISQLINLEQLYLSNNKLIDLPKNIGQLVKIEKLYLDNNELNFLPKTINKLQNIEILSLENNPFYFSDTKSQVTCLKNLGEIYGIKHESSNSQIWNQNNPYFFEFIKNIWPSIAQDNTRAEILPIFMFILYAMEQNEVIYEKCINTAQNAITLNCISVGFDNMDIIAKDFCDQERMFNNAEKQLTNIQNLRESVLYPKKKIKSPSVLDKLLQKNANKTD